MRLAFLPEAEIELDSATAEYAGLGTSPGGFSEEADRVLAQISRFPLSGPEFGKIRRCLFHGYPYAAIYRVFPEFILIISVMHTSRRPGYWRGRVTKK
jgi:hypothetical protein